MVRSAFGSRFGLQDFGLLVTPLILCGLAVAVTLRIGIWNIGAEGQFAMGAFATTAVGIFVAGPAPVMLLGSSSSRARSAGCSGYRCRHLPVRMSA